MKIISGEEWVNLQDDIKECADIEELKDIIIYNPIKLHPSKVLLPHPK